jgi:DNA repair protein RadC
MNARALKRHLKYKIPQLKLCILREPESAPMPLIRSPEDFEQYLLPMRHLSEEHFVTLHLSSIHQVIGYHLVSQGTLSSSLAHPREVFKAALLSNAYAIVLAHNHPAGSMLASPDDIQTTKQLVHAGKIMGVTVLDHLIVTHTGVYSIRENHPDLFES